MVVIEPAVFRPLQSINVPTSSGKFVARTVRRANNLQHAQALGRSVTVQRNFRLRRHVNGYLGLSCGTSDLLAAAVDTIPDDFEFGIFGKMVGIGFAFTQIGSVIIPRIELPDFRNIG